MRSRFSLGRSFCGCAVLLAWGLAPFAGAAPSVPLPADPAAATPAAPAVSAEPISQTGDQPTWVNEPTWLRAPVVDLRFQPTAERRPEPIPLPPAAIAGPIFLTTLIAGAMMKKNRARRN